MSARAWRRAALVFDSDQPAVSQYWGGSTMKLSRTVGYAVKATLQLADTQGTRPVPCSKIAAQGDMPERFLLQILRHLVTHGILQSTRGVDGGYQLERSPKEISLLEVIEAIDGPMKSGIPSGDGLKKSTQELLSDAINEITATVRQQLETIKLSQLMPPEADADTEMSHLTLSDSSIAAPKFNEHKVEQKIDRPSA